MNNNLAHWQQRLADHFSQLSARRRATGGNAPVFALEHGLTASELEAMAAEIRTHIAHSAPSRAHALPWIVYAAEIGYGYSGDEYWQTFEYQTKGWMIHGDRRWIRSRFVAFRDTYGGAQPTGAWAEHFSIISWPITNAVLPRDLQRQLARILYELRHSFHAELLESPRELGQLIASRSWSGSSRFQSFAENPGLVGQISAALLLVGQRDTDSLIDQGTLQRIASDLARERQAREWLRDAQRGAQERATIRGSGLRLSPASFQIGRVEEARAEVVALGIEPRLELHPKASNGLSWEVRLEVPALSHLLFRFPNMQGILTRSRCVIAGAARAPLARGECLRRAHEVTMSRWPRADEVLLQFDEKDAQLDYLLRTECLLRPGPQWLFRIASDGVAHEVRSKRVRPGERYVLVTTAGSVGSPWGGHSVALDCAGVEAVLLELPQAMTRDWEEVIGRFGLRQAKGIEVWPAGLGAVAWDGEGFSEWLAGERPCLAIQADHTVGEVNVLFDNDSTNALELTTLTPGAPVFVQLPQLSVGVHRVHISINSASVQEQADVGLDIVMRVREARPWAPGRGQVSPLFVLIDPPEPTLEQLWEGRVSVELRGSVGRNLKCTLSLYQGGAERDPVHEQVLTLGPLPLQPSQWRAHFERNVRENRNAQAAYDDARMCRLAFTAEDLGSFTLECERAFVPLRWVLRHRASRVYARLVDDSGAAESPEVTHYKFATPTKGTRLETHELPVEPPGGLFVARRGPDTVAVVAVPGAVRDFAALGVSPHVEGGERSVAAVLETLEYARLWGAAASGGSFLSSLHQRRVLQELARHALALIGGAKWARTESKVIEGGGADLAPLKQAVSSYRHEAGIAAAIALKTPTLASATVEQRAKELAQIAVSFHAVQPGITHPELQPPDWLAELALRVASNPACVAPWAGPYLEPSIRRLLEKAPVLARAARFMVLSIHLHLQSQNAPGDIYAGWEWQ